MKKIKPDGVIKSATKRMIEFTTNQPDKNKEYTKRIGAYVVLINEANLLAVVQTPTGFFLPGGGVEEGESLELCLQRECREEIGAEISGLENFAEGNHYFYSTTLNKDMENIGYFFTGKLDKFSNTQTEVDHELVWLSIEQALSSLYLENQRAAVRIFKAKTPG